jgi:membrane-bound metal-dependent hydrolase YbcI (DUF457 family)
MPITPYHFGPSALIGLAFRRRLDVPVFVLANVAVDVEVLFHYRYGHTLLVGTLVGAAWGLGAYPLRKSFQKVMAALQLPYQTGLIRMIVSGILGAWCHVLIDGAYHLNAKVFWPSAFEFWRIVQPILGGPDGIKALCLVGWAATIGLYAWILRKGRKQKTAITHRE